jgi:hypothetical protein
LLTEADIAKKLHDNLEEYNQVGDTKELVACLQELTPRLPAGRTESLGLALVSLALPKACDARTDGARDRVCQMLEPLVAAQLLKPDELQQLYRDSLEFLEDDVVDVPHIAHYYSRFLAHSIAARLIPLAFLPSALEPLIEAHLVKDDAAIMGQTGAAFMLVEILRRLKAIEEVGDAGVKAFYAEANLDLTALLPPDSRSDVAAAELLAAGGIAFVDPTLAELVQKAEAAANAEAIRAQLEEIETYLSSGVLIPKADSGVQESAEAGGVADAGGNDDGITAGAEQGSGECAEGGVAADDNAGESSLVAVMKWIDEHVKGQLGSDDKVARVVMRCVLHAAVLADEAPEAKKICKQISRCAKLLKKCTASNAAPKRLVKQAGCLYEVQAFCHTKGWPTGLMKKVFYNLYETDVVFEDAYGVWREDVNDVTPGKDKALFQVNEFLQWLDEAAEDDGEGDDDEAVAAHR